MSTPETPARESQVTIISHSQLFYWWPVWVCGFIMAIISFVDNHRMVIVPNGSEVVRNHPVTVPQRAGPAQEKTDLDVVVVTEGERMPSKTAGDVGSGPEDLRLHSSHRPGLAVVFFIVLLLVIVITNVPLRGMWSVVIIVTVILTSVIFSLAGYWGPILKSLGNLTIYMNAAGYIFISVALAVIWAITVFLFDRQIYIVFTPGQFKVCTEIGGGERVYDVMGLNLEKHRDDFFRHLILGLGSGDLVVRTSGAQAVQVDLHNVLFISSKVRRIEQLLKQRTVIETN
jgi:hypothetical protein